MRRRLAALMAASLLVIALAPATSASSATDTFDYFIGTAPLCDLDPSACPDVALAPNGDTIEVTGSGTISVHPQSATGGGTFLHKNAAGDVVGGGSWTADALISFHSYGSASAQGLPPELWGGQATLRVTLTAGPFQIPGILVVDCALGKVPAGAAEGVTVLATGTPFTPPAIHFNKSVSGFTVFVKTS